jgi:hypothetical protein
MGHYPGLLYSLEADTSRPDYSTSCRATEINGYPNIPGYNGRFLADASGHDDPTLAGNVLVVVRRRKKKGQSDTESKFYTFAE